MLIDHGDQDWCRPHHLLGSYKETPSHQSIIQTHSKERRPNLLCIFDDHGQIEASISAAIHVETSPADSHSDW